MLGTAVSAAQSAASELAADAPSLTLGDVTPDKWFYGDVTRLISEGVVHGYPDGNFYPDRDISNAEFVKILINSAGYSIDTPVSDRIFTDSWATEYLSLAHMLGIITDEDLESGFIPEAPITRAAMTRMTVTALAVDPAPIDDPFSDGSDDYAKAAHRLYLIRGIPGKDGRPIYNGGGHATRSEAAAVAIRIIDYTADPYAFFKDAVLENAESNVLNTEYELLDLFHVLNREFMTEFTFRTDLPIDVWTPYYRTANTVYLEYFYSSSLDCTYRPGSNTYKLKLLYDRDVDTLKKFRSEASEAADRVIADMINADMTPMERIKAIHDYIVMYCEYDYVNYVDDTIPLESRIAYGPLNAHIAVCQGYAAAFNLLCKRAGIRSTVISGISPASPDLHAWNMVLLDGERLFVDTTHDDPVADSNEGISHKYFLLTEEEMLVNGYLWDSAQSQIKYLY